MSLCSCSLICQLLFRMSMKILFITLVVLFVCPCIHSFKGHYPAGKNRPCCVGASMNNVSSKITGNRYYEQPARRPCVRALIFNTVDGQVCVDPGAPWVQKFIANRTKGM